MNAREASFKILLKFEESQDKLEDLIHDLFNNVNINPKEKKFAYNLSSGVVRNLSLLDWKIGSFYNGNYKKTLNKFKIILRLALFEIDYLDFIPNFATVNEYVNLAKTKLDKRNVAVINGILRSYLRDRGKYNPEKKFKYRKTQLSVKYSFPEWMIEKWINLLGENETELLCQSFNERPEFDIRINTNKINKQDFLEILENNQIKYDNSKYFSPLVKVIDIQNINKLKLFEKGYCSVQDESAFLVSDLIDIGEDDKILDACAAPGGKYTALLEKSNNKLFLIGSEINNIRIKKIKENCNRLQIENYCLVQSDVTNPPFKNKFNKILIDAPCSGMGTINKHPDIKWRRKENEIKIFQSLQLNILSALSKLLIVNGLLYYSTCTINSEENEEVIENFLSDNKSFELIPPKASLKIFTSNKYFIRTYPHKHKIDGSFVAILKRIS